MSLSAMNTIDPIALRYLMTDTIFAVEQGASPFVYFGRNKRNFLFLTQQKQHQWMPEAAMDAFIKTLAALKLAEDDVALLNLAPLAEAPSVEQLTLFFKPRVVVNLGTPFAWPERDGVKTFHTHAFEDMLSDAEKKRVFWTTIKHLLI